MDVMPRLTPLIVYLGILLLALTNLLMLDSDLPPRLATHFDAAGRANGWENAGQFLASHFALIPISLLLPFITFSIRFFPANLLNVPKKEYWTLPENHRRASEFLFYSSFWQAALTLFFLSGLFLLTVSANLTSPPELNNMATYAVSGIFLVGTLAWVVRVFVFFGTVPKT